MMDDLTQPLVDMPDAPEPMPPVPFTPAPIDRSPKGQVAALPRYTHGLLSQSLVASQMLEHPDGEWVRRADVLRLL